MLSVDRDELGRQFQSDFGDRFWAMAQCGSRRNDSTPKKYKRGIICSSGSAKPRTASTLTRGIQRFRRCASFQSAWKCAIADPDRNLPAWFTDDYKRYCSMATSLSVKTVRILFVHCNYPAQVSPFKRAFIANPDQRNRFSLPKQRMDSQ